MFIRAWHEEWRRFPKDSINPLLISKESSWSKRSIRLLKESQRRGELSIRQRIWKRTAMSEKQLIGRLAEREREIACEAIGKRWLTGKIDSRRALRVAYSSWSPPLGLSIQIWIRHTQSSSRWDRNKNTQKEDQTPSTRERERERERESLL